MLGLLVSAFTHHQASHSVSAHEVQDRILLLAFQLVVNAPGVSTLSAVVRVAPAFTPSRQTSPTLVSAGSWDAQQRFMVS